jgi:fructosamine-3-kinase
MLSPALWMSIDEALHAAGRERLRDVRELGGGSFGATFCIDAGTARFFLKLGAAAHPFDAEAQALNEIAATGTLRVPLPVAHGVAQAGGFLLLEWIDLAPEGDWAAAGRLLAAMHAAALSDYGWPCDNTIGATRQSNAPCMTWAEFWRERRLRPQFRLAHDNGLDSLAMLETRACAASDALLVEHAPPASLLHGDLWRGNLAFASCGRPVVFDPSIYHGDAETDLAMTRLFGGFPPAFYAAYDAVRPRRAGAAARTRLYQLYHVLNHANLFGGGYIAQACALVEALGSE